MHHPSHKHHAQQLPSRRLGTPQRDLVIQSLIRCPAAPIRGRS
jgi:hypothetical protein